MAQLKLSRKVLHHTSKQVYEEHSTCARYQIVTGTSKTKNKKDRIIFNPIMNPIMNAAYYEHQNLKDIFTP